MSVNVGVIKADKSIYPQNAPYHPAEKFPEYPFGENFSETPNYVYAAVRQLFLELEYDRENFGWANWNPLGFLIEPGMTVVLKPNFVRHRHTERKNPFAIITHPSILRVVADYCWIALAGKGKIIVADAPQYDANWAELIKLTRLDAVQDFYNSERENSFDVFDLRNYWSRGKHFPSMKIPLEGDPNGVVKINLGKDSAVKNIKDPKKLYGAVYHRRELIEDHTNERQIYELSGTVMKADVVISIPKLKTHKKVGVTMNIKGLVGVCTNKNLIVHYSLGSAKDGGDQYPTDHFTPLEERIIKIERRMYDTFLAKQSVPLEYVHRSIYWLHGRFVKPFGIGVAKEKRLLDVGNWHGNDSAWRMCVDLLKLILYADAKGNLHKTPQRKLFTIIDGIVGGENKGPLEPDAKESGVLIGGENLLAADIVAARLMGFDPLKIKTFSNLLAETDWEYGLKNLDEINVVSTNEKIRDCLHDGTSRFFDYRPYPGWVGHIEI